MEPVELEPHPDDGSGGCRAAIALTVAAACLPLMLGVFAPALRVGALAGAAVLLLGAACLMAVLRSSPTERVRDRNRERVLLRFGVRSDAWDGFSDGMFATDRDGVTLVVQNLRAWTVDILGEGGTTKNPRLQSVSGFGGGGSCLRAPDGNRTRVTALGRRYAHHRTAGALWPEPSGSMACLWHLSSMP